MGQCLLLLIGVGAGLGLGIRTMGQCLLSEGIAAVDRSGFWVGIGYQNPPPLTSSTKNGQEEKADRGNDG